MIIHACPNCGALRQMGDDLMGKRVRCQCCDCFGIVSPETVRVLPESEPESEPRPEPEPEPRPDDPPRRRHRGTPWPWLLAAVVLLLAVLLALFLNRMDQADYDEGRRALAVRDYDHALKCFNAALRKDRHNAKAFAGRAYVYFVMKDYGNAVRDASEAIRIDPAFDDAYRTRASAYAIRGDDLSAVEDRSSVIERNPRDADAYFDRASSYQSLMRLAEGLEQSREAAEYRKKMLADVDQAAKLDPKKYQEAPALFR
jgi:tetratricopeptide (TPR) repeat protein